MRLHTIERDTRTLDAAARFEPYRPALSGLAFNLLGSLEETDAALEDARFWLAELAPPGRDLGSWLARTTARVCLETLRLRATQALPPAWSLPDFVATLDELHDARQNALLGGGVGTGPFAALHSLSPDDRVALVLHDTYGVPNEDLGADVLCCSTADVERHLAHARTAMRDTAVPDSEIAQQHHVVHAFCRVAGRGDHRALAALLHDGFQLTNDSGDHAMSGRFTDVEVFVRRAIMLSRADTHLHPALINGAAGLVMTKDGHLIALVSLTVLDGLVARIDTLADHARIIRFDIPGARADRAPQAA